MVTIENRPTGYEKVVTLSGPDVETLFNMAELARLYMRDHVRLTAINTDRPCCSYFSGRDIHDVQALLGKLADA